MKAKAVASIALAAAIAASTVPTTPARADGGAITLAIVAGIITVSSLTCEITDTRGAEDKTTAKTLCIFSPFFWARTVSGGKSVKINGR
jgi:hypothetical protein